MSSFTLFNGISFVLDIVYAYIPYYISIIFIPIIIELPYILGYKSHFLNLNIGSKIECVLYVGNTKMYKNFTVKKITVYIDLQVDMSVNLLCN